MITFKRSYWWSLLFILAVGLGISLQFHLLFNPDNAWLLFITNKLLHGGRYFHDFIEVNPPLILYLNIPPVLVANLFHLSVYSTFTLYVVLISILMTALSYHLLKISHDFDNPLFLYLLIGALVYLFFYFFPAILGEREYLTTALILPYLFLLNLRVQEKPIRLLMSVSIGLLAGIGFAIKPYFLVPLALIEIYSIIRTKKLIGCVRPETISITLVLVIYFISIFLLTPEYIHQIVPFALKWYYLQFPFTLNNLVSGMPLIFYFSTFFVFFFCYRGSRHQILAEILLVASVGFTIAYLLGRQAWVYHFFPAYFLLALLMILLFADLFEKTIKSVNLSFKQIQKNAFFIIVMIAAFLLSPVGNSVKTTSLYYSNIVELNNHQIKALFTHKDRSFANFVSMYTLMVILKAGEGIPVIRYPNSPYLFEGYDALRARTHGRKALTALHQSKQELINLFVQDLKRSPPEKIIFNYDPNPDPKRENNRQNYPIFLKILLSNKSFQQIWKNYELDKFIRIVPVNYITPYIVIFRKKTTIRGIKS